MQRTYVIAGTQVGIRTTSRVFGDWLDVALGRYAIDRWEGADYSLVVPDEADSLGRGRRDFSVLYRGTTPIIRTLDLPLLGRALLTELSALRALERDDVILLALPTLVGRDGAVLVSPRIAVAIGELGRRAERITGLPAANFSAIDPASGQIVPLRPLLDTPAESWLMLGTLGPSPAAGAPLLVTEPVTVQAVCLSAREAGATPRPQSRVATLEALIARTPNFGAIGAAGVRGLARLVAGASCYELGRTDARQTLAALAGILNPRDHDGHE